MHVFEKRTKGWAKHTKMVKTRALSHDPAFRDERGNLFHEKIIAMHINTQLHVHFSSGSYVVL